MRALRFGLLGLCVGLMACGGSDFQISEEVDETGSGDGASAETNVGADSAAVDDTASSSDTGSTTDSGSAADGTTLDTAVADTAVADTGSVSDTGTVTDTGSCPTLVLGGAIEDVYVDKSAAAGGNGTKTCPFKTVLQATSLAAPGSSTTTRTIHVKGNVAAPDYVETNALILASKVVLTSNYDTASDGAVANVRLIARGDCTSLTGAGTTTYCAVGMNVGSRLELVTVRSTTGVSTGHAVLTTSALPASGGAPPRIVDVNAENANESAIRVYGSVSVGPRVNARNSGQGLNASRVTGAARAVINVLDAASLSGAPSNSFSSNRGNGFGAFGDFVITIEGLTASSNSNNGIVIGTPYTATTTTSHNLTNVQASSNGVHGFRLISGEVRVHTGAFTNRFSGNGQYGIQLSVGDITGSARLILDPKLGGGGGYVVGHEATRNGSGGVLLNQAAPPATAASSFSSLNASLNGSSAGAGLASGIFVQVTGVNQPSLILRGSTLLQNTGAGLRFQKASTNTLDVGSSSAGGYNIWGDATSSNRNAKSAICYENLTGVAVTQAAEADRWSQTCPLPLSSGGFQASLGSGGCGSNGGYVEITYTGATAPMTAVTSCF